MLFHSNTAYKISSYKILIKHFNMLPCLKNVQVFKVYDSKLCSLVLLFAYHIIRMLVF